MGVPRSLKEVFQGLLGLRRVSTRLSEFQEFSGCLKDVPGGFKDFKRVRVKLPGSR